MYNILNVNVFHLPRKPCIGFLTSVYFASLQSLHHSALDQVCLYFFMFLCTSKHRYFCTGTMLTNCLYFTSPLSEDDKGSKKRKGDSNTK